MGSRGGPGGVPGRSRWIQHVCTFGTKTRKTHVYYFSCTVCRTLIVLLQNNNTIDFEYLPFYVMIYPPQHAICLCTFYRILLHAFPDEYLPFYVMIYPPTTRNLSMYFLPHTFASVSPWISVVKYPSTTRIRNLSMYFSPQVASPEKL